MKKIQPKLLLVIFLGLILFVISSLSTKNKTPDPTANWKTYTNTKFSYSLQLLPTYTPLDAEFNLIKDPSNEFYVSFLKHSSEEAKKFKNDREKAYYDSLAIIIQGTDPCSTIDPYGMVRKEKILMEGIEGLRWTGSSATFADPLYGDVIIRVYKQPYCYKIYFLRNPNNLQKSEELLGQILSTFRFD